MSDKINSPLQKRREARGRIILERNHSLHDSVAAISGKWWTFMLRGIVALPIAAFAFAEPASAAARLVYILSTYFIISGSATLIAGFSGTRRSRWWVLLASGPMQIVVGLAMLLNPFAGVHFLSVLFGVVLVAIGAIALSSAVALRAHMPNERWSLLLGVATLAVGFHALFHPSLNLLALVSTVGTYMTVASIALIGLATKLKIMNRRLPTTLAVP